MPYRVEILVQKIVDPGRQYGLITTEPETVISMVRSAKSLPEAIEMVKVHLDMVKESE